MGKSPAIPNAESEVVHHKRVCHICDQMCGVTVATVGGAVINVRPNREDRWSRGHICPKGTVLGELYHDPDRLRTPMIREGEAWRAASWDEAFAHIAKLADPILSEQGPQAFAYYIGNMFARDFTWPWYLGEFLKWSRITTGFTASTIDQQPKNVVCHLMYGNLWKFGVPDIDHCDLLVVLGGNPAESQGSLWAHQDAIGAIRAMPKRGGKVIVVDPRRTRTAKAAGEWVGIRPGTDAAMLLAIGNVLFNEYRVRLGHLEGLVNGVDELRDVVRPFSPAAVADFCGLSAERIRKLAKEIIETPNVAIYGRIGLCTQEFGTLATWMCDVLSILTGNFDRKGGTMWGDPVATSFDLDPIGYPPGAPVVTGHSPRTGAPIMLGQIPCTYMADELADSGPDRIRGLVTFAGNPALSVPGSTRVASALENVECMISFDNYINETTRHAHVILPSTPHLEAPHWDASGWSFALKSGGHYSPPIFRSDRPDDWRVLLRVGAIIGGNPLADVEQIDDEHFAAKCRYVGVDVETAMKSFPGRGPERLIDLAIRVGPYGDRYQADSDGLALSSFRSEPDGLIVGEATSQGVSRIATPSGRIELAPAEILADIPRLSAALSRRAPDLVLISRRSIRSMNSWIHNVPSLQTGKDRCTVEINPLDAQSAGIEDGDLVRVSSVQGEVVIACELTEDLNPGVICLPHGWGHRDPQSRLRVANRHPGVSTNILTPIGLTDRVSGNAIANGIEVRIARANAEADIGTAPRATSAV